MTPKPLISKDFRKNLAPISMDWYNLFIDKSNSVKGYISNIKEFLEFCSFKNSSDITKLTPQDFENYITELKRLNAAKKTINRRIYAIKSMAEFFRNNYKESFGENYLKNLPDLICETEENPTDIRRLNLEQLHYARNFNKSSLEFTFIFEMFFQFSIDKVDLITENYKKSELPKYPINFDPSINFQVTEWKINNYFEKLTNYIMEMGCYERSRRKINSYDLRESHKFYFFTCPICKRELENISTNWVLVKVESQNSESDDFHLACSFCKGKDPYEIPTN
ncbi:hypothetical protein SDC9_97321 [bioreactor metagenome]|uniref:Core-binding (CB) domain-containing protein n=1 Tax=bioreactor metagenome TaxID=1076179 RepID=A0A645ABJ9_9ZZZZ